MTEMNNKYINVKVLKITSVETTKKLDERKKKHN